MSERKWRNFTTKSGARQIPINLQSEVAITITCNLGKQGVCNILPPRTCRYKTAFIVIYEADSNKPT